MGADDVVENLPDGEEKSGSGEVQHRPLLAKDSENQNRLQHKKRDEEYQGRELVQDIDSNVAVWRIIARVKVASPSEARVESDVPGPDNENGGRDDDQANGEWGSIVDDLVANNGIKH